MRDKRGARLVLGARPLDRALRVVDAERVVKIALGHQLGGAAVVVLALPAHLRQFRRAVAVFQDAEHAAAIDARKLPVVADQNQLGARLLRMAGELRHELGVDHRGFVDDDDGARVPRGAAIFEGEELAVDGRGAAEAVAAHVLGDGVGRGEADDPVTLGLVGVADGAIVKLLPVPACPSINARPSAPVAWR